MKRIKVTFTQAELTLLCSLSADQLFRREFIDPRIPGNKSNLDELSLGKQILERLRPLIAPAGGTMVKRTAQPKARAMSHS
jgi:hypothetical protein